MITSCPECNGKVSDSVDSCPHCGFALVQPEPPQRKIAHKRGIKRRPRGAGRPKGSSAFNTGFYGCLGVGCAIAALIGLLLFIGMAAGSSQ